MVFSSLSFLLLFLPAALLIYFLSPRRARNAVLFIISLVFYAWGEPVYVVLMLFSTLTDYTIGRLMERWDARPGLRRAALIASLTINFGLLGFFKYSGLLVETVNGLFSLSLPVPRIALPIGISFYTFQTLSYSIDVCDALEHRRETWEGFYSGTGRFLCGMVKKVLLANGIGQLWEQAAAISPASLSTLTAWLGAFAYAFQIYFDFSGYSDMAIGLGRMFGFTFPENFNYPYISRSVTARCPPGSANISISRWAATASPRCARLSTFSSSGWPRGFGTVQAGIFLPGAAISAFCWCWKSTPSAAPSKSCPPGWGGC